MNERQKKAGPELEVRGAEGTGLPRRRRRWVWRWLLRPAVGLMALLAAVTVALALWSRTDTFRAWLATRVTDQLSRALDRPVSIESAALDWLPLALEVRGLRIPGPDPEAPPLLEVRSLRVEGTVEGLRPLRIHLRQMDLESPRLYLHFDSEGNSNLPRFPRRGDGEARLEVALERLLVQDGSLRLEELEVPLELDARQLWGRLSGGAGGAPYRILLTAGEVVTELPAARSYPAAVSVRATLGSGGLDIVESRLRAAELSAEVSGTIRWGEGAASELAVTAEGEAALANRLGYLDEPIEGPWHFEGAVRWGGGGWSWDGAAASDRLRFLGRRFEQVSARLGGDRSGVRVEVDRARHAAGDLSGTLDLDLGTETGGRPARLELRARGLELRRLLDDLDLPLEGLGGRLSGELGYRFSTAAPFDGSGGGDLGLTGVRRRADELAVAGTVPIGIESGRLAVRGARLEARSQSVRADVEIDLGSGEGSAELALSTRDLGELAELLPGLRDPAEEPLWLPREGVGEILGSAVFSPRGFSSQMRFELAEVVAPGFAVDTLEGSFELIPGRVEGLRATARRALGELTVVGSFDLPAAEPSVEPAVLDLRVDTVGWPAETLEPWWPEAPEVAGGVSGSIAVGGTTEALEVTAELTAEPLRLVELEVGRAEVELHLAGTLLHLDRLLLSWPMGEVSAGGSVDLESGALDLALSSSGLDLGREPLAGRLAGDLAGVAEFEVRVAGTFEDPAAELKASARDLAVGGRRLMEGGGAELTATWLEGRLAAGGDLLGLIRFEGGGELDPQIADLTFSLASDRVEQMLALVFERPPEVEGTLAGELAVTGPWTDLSARLELARLDLVAGGKPIHNLLPVVAELGDGALRLESLFLGEPATGSELFVAGRVELADEMPLDLKLQGSLAAGWARPLLPVTELEGTFDVLATIRGTVGNPVINGQGELHGARAILSGFPHALERVRAIVLFDPGVVVLDNLTASVAGGAVRAAGRLEVPRAGEPWIYSLQAQAEGLTLHWPEGWILRGGAQVTLVAPAADGARELRGVVDLDRAVYLEDVNVSLGRLVTTAFERQRLAVQTGDELLSTTWLNLGVRGKEALRVRNNVADLRGGLDLTLRGTLARPVVFGQAELAAGGTVTFRDNDYRVQRGLLTFSNPYKVDPVIDVVATTKVKSYEVQLNLSGTADRLDASFTSDPPLADLEVLRLLTTGVAPDETRGGALAESFLYGQAASVISQRVNTLFGFDKFRINPGASGSQEILSGVGFVIEQRLSRDVSVTFTRDPSTSERDILQVEWSVSPGLTLILTGEGDSSFALDARWERSF